MLKTGRYEDSKAGFVRRQSVLKAHRENRSVFWVAETEFLGLLEPEDEGITILRNGGNYLPVDKKRVVCHNNCVGTSDLQMFQFNLIFQSLIIRRGFQVTTREHAGLKRFRVMSSSRLSNQRRWIIKCRFYYTRWLPGEFSELVIVRKNVYFFIHTMLALCARVF